MLDIPLDLGKSKQKGKLLLSKLPDVEMEVLLKLNGTRRKERNCLHNKFKDAVVIAVAD